MHTVPLKLVTIVAGEPVLEAQLTTRLKSLGTTGYTVTECHGEGSRGLRASDIPGTGVRIEAIVTDAIADRIVAAIAEEYFPRYSLIVWVADVTVVRGEKYIDRR